MREPFYMDRLNGDDRRKVRRLLAQVLVFYLSLVVLLVARFGGEGKPVQRDRCRSKADEHHITVMK